MTGYIYKIVNNIDNMSYIGQTTYSVKMRWGIHKSPKSTCTYLKNAIAKHGVENFTVIVLETIEESDKDTLIKKLNDLEELYMKQFNTLSPYGYNLMPGGRNAYRGKSTKPRGGWKQTEEAKRKIALANIGKKKGPRAFEVTIANAEKHKKPIKCNETGQIWPSIKECAEFFKVKNETIHRVLRGVRDHFHGMSFSYVNPERSKPKKIRVRKVRSLGSYDLTGLYKRIEKQKRPIKCNETGQTWGSIQEAADFFGAKNEAIHRVLRGVRNHYKNFTFSYI